MNNQGWIWRPCEDSQIAKFRKRIAKLRLQPTVLDAWIKVKIESMASCG